MRRAVALAGALALAGAFAFPASADIGPFKWRAHAPFTMTIVSSVADPALQSALTASMGDWSASSVVDMVYGPQPKRGIYVKVVESYNSGWNGLTVISNDHGYIVGATIYLNRTNTDQFSQTFKQHVVCQELGHALGLDHQDGVMDSCMGPNADAPHPNARDFADLEAMY